MLTISGLETFLKKNPHVQQVPGGAFVGDPILQGVRKPTDGFRDLLKEMKRKHRSYWNPCTINTF